MPPLYPLHFRPIFRRYLWGNRRLETSLGKPIGPGEDWAESWEICDHAADQSVVEFGPLAGTTLGQLVQQRGPELLGRHHPQQRFPLLLKFLDANQTLSVQVHPNDARAAMLTPPDLGKTEAWVVLEATPDSIIYAGLMSGVDRETLNAAIREGRCQECLHSFAPTVGDCIFIPAGTVHALGTGLLVAEIQQSSDVTYRLFDWNRLGPDGQPRALHIEQGLDVVDYGRGPVRPQQPQPTERRQISRLVACEQFVLDRWEFDSPLAISGDGRCHIVAVLEGSVALSGEPSNTAMRRGHTALIPASAGAVTLSPKEKAVLLDAYLP